MQSKVQANIIASGMRNWASFRSCFNSSLSLSGRIRKGSFFKEKQGLIKSTLFDGICESGWAGMVLNCSFSSAIFNEGVLHRNYETESRNEILQIQKSKFNKIEVDKKEKGKIDESKTNSSVKLNVSHIMTIKDTNSSYYCSSNQIKAKETVYCENSDHSLMPMISCEVFCDQLTLNGCSENRLEDISAKEFCDPKHSSTRKNSNGKTLTHLDEKGNANMVDIGGKPKSKRMAVARSLLWVGKEAGMLILDNRAKKGDVFGVARIAGIMAAKKTSTIIPLCHQVQLSYVKIDLHVDENKWDVVIIASVASEGGTGVEMEALVAVSVATLTVYDMVKSVAGRSGMAVREICLLHKEGGTRGDFHYREPSAS